MAQIFLTVGMANEERFLPSRLIEPRLRNIDPRGFSAVTLFDTCLFPVAPKHCGSGFLVIEPGIVRTDIIGQVENTHLGQDGKGVKLGKVGLGDKAQELVHLVVGTLLGLRVRL